MQVVYAKPKNSAARLLAADAMEQLAYQAESGVWRNACLSGAGPGHKHKQPGRCQGNTVEPVS